MGVDSVARSLAISALNSSGGGVTSVNGQTGVVVLDAEDVGAQETLVQGNDVVINSSTNVISTIYGGTPGLTVISLEWITGLTLAPTDSKITHITENRNPVYPTRTFTVAYYFNGSTRRFKETGITATYIDETSDFKHYRFNISDTSVISQVDYYQSINGVDYNYDVATVGSSFPASETVSMIQITCEGSSPDPISANYMPVDGSTITIEAISGVGNRMVAHSTTYTGGTDVSIDSNHEITTKYCTTPTPTTNVLIDGGAMYPIGQVTLDFDGFIEGASYSFSYIIQGSPTVYSHDLTLTKESETAMATVWSCASSSPDYTNMTITVPATGSCSLTYIQSSVLLNQTLTQVVSDTLKVNGQRIPIDGSTITLNSSGQLQSSGGSSSGAVRYDQAQSLTEAQQNQAYSNLNLGCARTTTRTTVINATGLSIYYNASYGQFSNYSSGRTIDITGLSIGTSCEITLVIDGTSYVINATVSTTPTAIDIKFQNLTEYGITSVEVGSSKIIVTADSTTYTGKYLQSISIKGANITTYTTIDSNLIPPASVSFAVAAGTGTDSLILGTAAGKTASGKNSAVYGEVLYSGGTITASNDGSFAGGYVANSGASISSSGDGSFAGGAVSSYAASIMASGNGSFAYGNPYQGVITASGTGSVALGNPFMANVTASGSGSVAIGNPQVIGSNNDGNTEATASGSVAIGAGVKSNSANQTVIGKDNVADSASTYAFIIGNGTADDARSNALTVDWSGNVVCNNIPAPPSTDGTYNLQCSIVSGVITYSWVSVS